MFVRELVVTSLAPNGFFAQLPPGSAGYVGPARSGIFVFTGPGNPRPARGDLVTITQAKVATYFGQIQLQEPEWTTQSQGHDVSAQPLFAEDYDALAASLASWEYESVLVEVTGAIVTNLHPPAGAGDDGLNEHELDVGLRVDDLIFPVPLPSVPGHEYERLRGIAAWRNEHMKLLPRDLADLQ